jgi:hypothetical protein
MFGNPRLRSGARHLTFGRRLPAIAGLLGVVLATVFGVGAAVASSRHESAAPARASSVSSDIRADEAFVNGRWHHCAGFGVHGSCPFQAAATANGFGGHLIAVNLRWWSMDACERGLVYFFDGTRLIVKTSRLRPFSSGGVKVVRADGTRKFSVVFFVSRSKFTSCAENGNAGTDTYSYRWTGSRMTWNSGRLPRLPKVIVGSPADN